MSATQASEAASFEDRGALACVMGGREGIAGLLGMGATGRCAGNAGPVLGRGFVGLTSPVACLTAPDTVCAAGLGFGAAAGAGAGSTSGAGSQCGCARICWISVLISDT